MDFDINFDFDFEDKPSKEEPKQKVRTRSLKTRETQFYKRFKSETELEEHIDWEFEQGAAYHVISGGDIDSLSFLKMVIRQQPLKYLILSTWCMALQDIEELTRYIELKRIERLDSYVGEIFKGTYWNEYAQLCKLHENVPRHGNMNTNDTVKVMI